MAKAARPEWLRQACLEGKNFSFKTKTAWKHNLINLTVFALALDIIGLCIWAGFYFTGLAYLALAVPVMGFAFFCLYVLVIHEASHGMFILAKKRKTKIFWNRLFAWPISIFFFTHYRKLWEIGHLEHHVRPIEENDPQSLNRVTGFGLFAGVAALLLIPGYVFIQRVFVRAKLQQKGSSWWTPIAGLVTLGAVSALTGLLVSWWVPLAILMALQLLGALNEIKGALEHGGDIAFHPEPLLRSRTSLFLLRPFIMPLNISMHFEHHLNHTVPWYELVNYHKAIKPMVPEEIRDNLFNTHLLPQMLGKLPMPLTSEMKAAMDASDVMVPAAAE